MRRSLSLLAAAAALCGQTPVQPPVEGRYHYAAFTVKPGVAFEARTKAGLMILTADRLRQRQGARFTIDHPAADGGSSGGGGGAALTLAAAPSGGILAGSGSGEANGAPELFFAMRAPGEADTVTLSAGEWAGVAVTLAKGKPGGLTTAFGEFTVGRNGVPGDWQAVTHEAAVDDVVRPEKWAVAKFASQAGGKGMMEIAVSGLGSPLAGRYDLLLSAGGDAFAAVPASGTGLILALRRDRDANTMTLRGPYALAEIGARMSFAFSPETARFFSTTGRLEAAGGTATLSQQVRQPDRVTEFHGQVAYMVGPGGIGSLSPRLEQRRRNLVVGENAAVLLSAQVAEAGQLSLLHGIGIAVRLLEPVAAPELAARAVAAGETLSLYGRNLTAAGTAAEGLQVLVAGQPAAVLMATPNQINVRLGAPAAAAGSKLKVEIERQGQRLAPVEVAVEATPPAFEAAPTAMGGLIALEKPAHPGDVVELRLTGAPPPAGAMILIDGQAASTAGATVVPYRGNDAKLAGTAAIKVTIPAQVTPGPAVSVALATSHAYLELGQIAVAARPAPPAAAAAH